MNKSAEPKTLSLTTTSLEMTARPTRPAPPPPRMNEPVMLVHAQNPTLSFYRYLYNTIGEEWLWYERRVMDDATLSTIIHDEKVFMYALYVGGVPAGYVELDYRAPSNIEVAYLGLIPEFVGRGLGWRLVDWALEDAWNREPDRVWIHTCNFDHPAALPLYQKAGFSPFNQETIEIPNPRLLPCYQ
jgi:GNAT superfamily N-acetyltransferase